MRETPVSRTGARRADAIVLPLAFALLVSLLTPAVSHASPHHGHHHYGMGIRAYAGTRIAAALYLETGGTDLDLTLAREDAADMQELAAEIAERGERLKDVLQTYEREAIGDMVNDMIEASLETHRLSAELEDWIIKAGDGPATPEFLDAARLRTRDLFWRFSGILATHKKAEAALGIPVPPEPPAP